MKLHPWVVLLLLAVARPVGAATITIENLWDLPITFVDLGLDNTALISADYGIKPSSSLDLPITAATPLLGHPSLTFDLPETFDAGFIFGGLSVSGTCPNNCSWASRGNLFPGDVIGSLEATLIQVFWPTTDPT